MKTACVIVIGHVDHGKTALVRALTGIETDRLSQEKQRGLSITLGFAFRAYASGTVDLIDAPGHEDFVREMVAGATGAQGAMLVVSATEGVAPQTLEHLRISRLLAVPVQIVAVTKADLLTVEELPERLERIRETLGTHGVTDVPLVACSVMVGGGLDALDAALEGLLGDPSPHVVPKAPFLPIDRVFSMQGMGTVVTGTLLGGALTTGDAVRLYPRDMTTNIRGLQTRGEDRDSVCQGHRTAVNLRGVAVADVSRGDVLCGLGKFAPTDCMDVRLDVLPDAPRPLRHMTELRVLFGTAHEVATVRLMGGGQIVPGQQGFGQLRFRRSVVGYAGQRAILRALSPAATLGGAVVLDPQAVPVKSSDSARGAVMQAAANQDVIQIAKALCRQGRGAASLKDVARLSRLTKDALEPSLQVEFTLIDVDMIAHLRKVESAQNDLLARLGAYHAAHPIKPMVPRRVLNTHNIAPALSRYVEAALAAKKLLRVEDDQIALMAHDPETQLTDVQRDRLAEIEAQLESGGVTPPEVKILTDGDDGEDLLELLITTGRAVSVFNVALKKRLVFHAAALTRTKLALHEAFPPPKSFTTSEARVALGTSRKFIVPLLEHFDSQGVTLRSGDTRQIGLDAL